MTNRSARSLAIVAVAVAVMAPGRAVAQTAVAKPAAAPTVAGTWNVTMMSHQVALVLEQDGTRVTGTLTMMSTEAKVDGTFADGVLKLTSNAKVSARPPAATHTESQPAHAGAAKEGTTLTLTARLLDDGTLAGEMPGPNGPLTWTGERLRAPRPKAAAPTIGPGLTGVWKMSATTPQGTMAFDLSLEQNGEKITGTLSSAHSGELKLEGAVAQGTLTFSTGGTGPNAMRLDYRATVKDDGTLAGELTGPNVKMPWTAERVKK